MKILTGKQIREADQYTIANELISSIDLMERASIALSDELEKVVRKSTPLLIIIGKGNNGGDGLAMARILCERGYHCSVYCLFEEDVLSEDCRENLHRLPPAVSLLSPDFVVADDAVIIDAIFGSGIRGVVYEPAASVIRRINQISNPVISIDLPSGMSTEWQQETDTLIRADYTLTIQFPKLAMLLPDYGQFCGEVRIVPIGLSETYIAKADSNLFYCDEEYIKYLLVTKRDKFSYKNKFGHTLLICGSKNMSGAATLATGSALRSGCGLVTTHIPYSERIGIMTNYPSAMLSFDDRDCFSRFPYNIGDYSSIAVGCGIGQLDETVSALEKLLKSAKVPMVIDADALNIIAASDSLRKYIPKDSILTPHVGELRRLIGEWGSEQEKFEKVQNFSSEIDSIVIVKGAYTAIFCPDGSCWFNSTGNAGMAKGGSGDVLTGLLVGLLARGYNSVDAAKVGVYIHGLAGDLAAADLGQEAMNSKDIIDYLPKAFQQFEQ
ncbi:NAD(P)H-hydrate dehydratase [Dysgonomonas massiliensis]|uniref:NAD(P)H-hydrate dehydratase n=1 Tax=Dysgonomonas massiliensis TaxID=2040292 RepID=UPI000C767B1B|nr:NAD(P)H-hydrate dehydratase [Dysgonomonas massiliensis]